MPGGGRRGCCSPTEPGTHGQLQLGELRGRIWGNLGWRGGGGAVLIPVSPLQHIDGCKAAEAKHRFPIECVYLAPALLTLKQEGLKVNSLSIPYCQLIHHPKRARAAQALPAPAPMSLGG